MVQLFSRYWWSFIGRGVVAILFGVIVLLCAPPSLDLMVLCFGLFALLQGILSSIPGFSKLSGRIYFLLIEGVLGIVAAVLTFLGPGIGRMLWPEVTTRTLLVFVTLWALLSGITELIGSFRLPGEIKERWLITLSGLICLVLGLFLLFQSEAGVTGKASQIGLFGIVFGLLWLWVGLRARKVYSR